MSGSLKLIDQDIITSSSSTASLTGITSDYDVYILKYDNVTPSSAGHLQMRVTESGVDNETSNYDGADSGYKAGGYDINKYTNQTEFKLSAAQLHATVGFANGEVYIHNASNSSAYTYITIDNVQWAAAGSIYGSKGAACFTQTSAVDGLTIFMSGSFNLETGNFYLYALEN